MRTSNEQARAIPGCNGSNLVERRRTITRKGAEKFLKTGGCEYVHRSNRWSQNLECVGRAALHGGGLPRFQRPIDAGNRDFHFAFNEDEHLVFVLMNVHRRLASGICAKFEHGVLPVRVGGIGVNRNLMTEIPE